MKKKRESGKKRENASKTNPSGNLKQMLVRREINSVRYNQLKNYSVKRTGLLKELNVFSLCSSAITRNLQGDWSCNYN